MNFYILYFATVEQSFGGVEQKVLTQYDALRKIQSNVMLYLISSYPPERKFAIEIEKRAAVKVLVNEPGKVKNPFSRRKEKFDLITNLLKGFNPENTIVYLRHPDADFLFLEFLKSNKEFTIVTEHNEIENKFDLSLFSSHYIRNIFEILFGREVRKRISAMVGVTSEITSFQVKKSGDLYKNSITLGNGIDVNKYTLRELNKDHQEVIKLLFVGAGYSRHGLDRVIKGMASYLNNGESPYKIILRIAGDSSQMDKNKALAKSLKVEHLIEFLGYNYPEDLDVHFDWADIGIGSLGFHRVGLKYTSNLKAREYFSRGLPFVSSSIDEDLLGCSDYVYMVDPDDSVIDMKKIVNYALHIRSDVKHPQIMRTYAESKLDWSVKMEKLVTFLKSLLDSPKLFC